MRFDVKFNPSNQRLPVQFQPSDQQLPIQFHSNNQSFEVAFDAFQTVKLSPDTDRYEGTYDVTPLITSQVLPTNRKFMEDDVRVDMIPTKEINNEYGGVTFIVGR